ncbi:MAG: hypothetical protein IJ893_10065 [Bacteroidales bacterium]|nr:hypothetical protein [Bacteroidales bacterium]MBR6863262.1 hypothetical protein [Bacteroidales bacterium]
MHPLLLTIIVLKESDKKDKGAPEYISPKYRKDAMPLNRELGLEFLSLEMVDDN